MLNIEPRGKVYLQSDGNIQQWSRVINGYYYTFVLYKSRDESWAPWAKAWRHPYGKYQQRETLHKFLELA